MDQKPKELPKSIDIQKITPEQWRDYEFLRHTMLKSDPEAFPPQAFDDLRDSESEWVRRINEGIVLIAYDGISPIGMARATFINATASVRNMYTLDSYRGIGLGRKLLEEVIGKIQDKGGVRNIDLEVESTQETAIKMYESFGFYESSRIPNEKEVFMITMRKGI